MAKSIKYQVSIRIPPIKFEIGEDMDIMKDRVFEAMKYQIEQEFLRDKKRWVVLTEIKED